MTFEFNIFGKNGKKDLYYKSYKKELLHQITENSQEKSQMTVYREEKIVHYVYTERLSNSDDYFGVCLTFNNNYCTDNKRLFELFKDTTKGLSTGNGKILKSKFGTISFATTDFSRNKVEIGELEKVFQAKIDTDFATGFQQIDYKFEYGDETPQFVSLQDTSDYIVENIKKYCYVTITQTPKEQPHNHTKFEWRILNFKQNHKWVKWFCLVIFLSILALLIFLLKKERCSLYGALWLEVPLVLSLYFLFFEKFTRGKNEIMLTVFSFIVSIFGLALTIDNNVFSQSDGEYLNIVKRSFQKNNTIDISQSLNEWDSIPHLVFVLDVSGSTYSKKYDNNEESEELFKDVCRQMITDTTNIKNVLHNFLHKKKFTEYTEYDIYKLKILKIVAEKQEMYKNKIDIVCFAGDVKREKNVDCKKIINIINNLESNIEIIENDKTNFIKLITELLRLYSETPKKNQSDAPKYTFLFFSDYLHDIGETFTNKTRTQAKREITTLMYNFYSKQNFSNYFFTNHSTPIEKEKEISVLPIFKELIDENSKAHLVKMEDDEYDFMDILSKEVIPIYYEHSYPTNDLNTEITFKNLGNNETVRIALKKNPRTITDCHHQFAIYEKDATLVSPTRDIELSSENLLTLTFSGRIIDSYSSTLLTFQSKNRGYARFDIVFFKDLPWFVRYIIASTIFFFYLFLLSLIVSMFNLKKQ